MTIHHPTTVSIYCLPSPLTMASSSIASAPTGPTGAHTNQQATGQELMQRLFQHFCAIPLAVKTGELHKWGVRQIPAGFCTKAWATIVQQAVEAAIFYRRGTATLPPARICVESPRTPQALNPQAASFMPRPVATLPPARPLLRLRTSSLRPHHSPRSVTDMEAPATPWPCLASLGPTACLPVPPSLTRPRREPEGLFPPRVSKPYAWGKQELFLAPMEPPLKTIKEVLSWSWTDPEGGNQGFFQDIGNPDIDKNIRRPEETDDNICLWESVFWVNDLVAGRDDIDWEHNERE